MDIKINYKRIRERKQLKNVYINITRRNCLINITNKENILLYKGTFGSLDIDKQERKNKLSYYKLGLYIGYLINENNGNNLIFHINCWSKIYKRVLKGILKYKFRVLKLHFKINRAHNGTKIRNERRR